MINYGAEFFPSEISISDRTPDDHGHNSGHKSCASIPRRSLEEGTLKKSSRVPILPVTTDVAKSLTLKRTRFIPAQRVPLINGDMNLQRSRKLSDGDIRVEKWTPTRNGESCGASMYRESQSHSRTSSLVNITGHFIRPTSFETDSILRDAPPRELSMRGEVAMVEVPERNERELEYYTMKRGLKTAVIQNNIDPPTVNKEDSEPFNQTIPPPMTPIATMDHFECPGIDIRPSHKISTEIDNSHNSEMSGRNIELMNTEVSRQKTVGMSITSSPPRQRITDQEPVYYIPTMEDVDMEELPPPPPELLIDYGDDADNPSPVPHLVTSFTRGTWGREHKKKPPPPPKRSSTTHLTYQV